MSRRTIALGALGAVVVIVAWFVILWSPQSQAIDDARVRRDVAQAEAARLELQLQRLTSLADDEVALRARLDDLMAAVPDGDELAALVVDLDTAAQLAGVEVVAITPSPPTAPEAPGPVPIDIVVNVDGGYFQVLDFVNRVLDLERIVVIESVNANASVAGTLVDLNVTIAATAFMATAPPDLTAEPVTPVTSVAPAGDGSEESS